MNFICNRCSGSREAWALKHRAGKLSVFFSSSVTSVPASGERGGGRIPDAKVERTNLHCKMERWGQGVL